MNRKIKFLAVVFTVLTLGSLLGFRMAQDDDRYFQIVKNLDIFVTLFKEVNAYYVDEINPADLMKTGIDAMLKSLDPYTNYIPEDDIEEYRTMTTGEYGGIGALVDRKDGINTIVMIFKNSPTDKAGLKIGDQILKINGISLSGKSTDDLEKLLAGANDTPIEMQIRRFGKSQPFVVSLKREKITIANVPYHGMINRTVGYLKLTDFTSHAGREVASAVKNLKSMGAKQIILDLRGNPGGLLDEAINVSNVFIPSGKEVVSTKGKLESWTKRYDTQAEPVDTQIPLVVLIDNGSASASEIVAGVVQDYDRGILVGRKTYGKGLVQQSRPLAYNAQLKVTTAKYYIPSGRCIQAIDYSHRNTDGSVGKLPDSLKTTFYTQSGRVVYDGGGLDPDVDIDPVQFAKVTYSLMEKDLIFHYATEFHYTHDSIASAKDFQLSDEQYRHFTAWLDNKEYAYTTQVEEALAKLYESAREETYFDDIQSKIEDLRQVAIKSKEADIRTYSGEIRMLLEQEIASRYYHQEGIVENTFDNDPDIMAAINVLSDTVRYNQLLKSKK